MLRVSLKGRYDYVYVRESYVQIKNLIAATIREKDSCSCGIVGSPQIGKTTFMSYIIPELLLFFKREGKTLDGIFIIGHRRGGSTEESITRTFIHLGATASDSKIVQPHACPATISTIDEKLMRNCLVLVDGVRNPQAVISDIPYAIYMVSPHYFKDSTYNDSHAVETTYCLETWSKEELIYVLQTAPTRHQQEKEQRARTVQNVGELSEEQRALKQLREDGLHPPIHTTEELWKKWYHFQGFVGHYVSQRRQDGNNYNSLDRGPIEETVKTMDLGELLRTLAYRDISSLRQLNKLPLRLLKVETKWQVEGKAKGTTLADFQVARAKLNSQPLVFLFALSVVEWNEVRVIPHISFHAMRHHDKISQGGDALEKAILLEFQEVDVVRMKIFDNYSERKNKQRKPWCLEEPNVTTFEPEALDRTLRFAELVIEQPPYYPLKVDRYVHMYKNAEAFDAYYIQRDIGDKFTLFLFQITKDPDHRFNHKGLYKHLIKFQDSITQYKQDDKVYLQALVKHGDDEDSTREREMGTVLNKDLSDADVEIKFVYTCPWMTGEFAGQKSFRKPTETEASKFTNAQNTLIEAMCKKVKIVFGVISGEATTMMLVQELFYVSLGGAQKEEMESLVREVCEDSEVDDGDVNNWCLNAECQAQLHRKDSLIDGECPTKSDSQDSQDTEIYNPEDYADEMDTSD